MRVPDYFAQARFLVISLICLLGAAPWASAYTITVTSTAQGMQPPGQGCTITEAILLVDLGAQAIGPGIRPGEPLLGNCTMEIGGDGITIVVPAGEYLLTTPYLNMDGQAGFPLIGPTHYPFIGVPWGVRIVGDPEGGTIIKRETSPETPKFRFFHVQTWLELEHLTLSGGDAGGDPNGGGAIFGDDSMLAPCPPGFSGPCRLPITLRHVAFENNRAVFGGALASVYRVYGQGFTFTIEDSTFRGNHATHGGGAIRVPDSGWTSIVRSRFEDNLSSEGGGAIFSSTLESIEVQDTTFLRNRANAEGGAIHAPHARLTRVVMDQNTSHGRGGALYSYAGRLNVLDSTFTGTQGREGGGIYSTAGGSVEIRGSAFVNNVATQQNGGAIELHNETGSSLLSNSTFAGNAAVDRGGAVYVYGGTLAINNVTIAGNTSGYGPGLALGWWGGSTVRIGNSIVAGNVTTAGPVIDVQVGPNESLTSLGYNIIGTDLETRGLFTGPGDRTGTDGTPLDAGLLPLADNGGPTDTRALAPGSPALDAGSPASPGSAEACEATDQRGEVRSGPGSGRCDIGAFEAIVTFPVSLTVGPGGSVTGLSAQACTGTCAFDVPRDSVLTLVATPAAGFTFDHWTGDCSGAPLVCSVSVNAATTIAVSFSELPFATSLTLESSPSPSVATAPVTLTARATSSAPAVPAGLVTFSLAGGETIGETPLASDGTAKLITSSLALGSVSILASYSGGPGFLPSSEQIVHVVQAPTATVALRSSANPSVPPITFIATVTATAPATAIPTGYVTFIELTLARSLGSVALDANGQAALVLPNFTPGERTVRAIYTGDVHFGPAMATIDQTVLVPDRVSLTIPEGVTFADGSIREPGPAPVPDPVSHATTTTITPPAAIMAGQRAPVIVTVRAVAPELGTPHGTVIVTVAGTDWALPLDGTGRATMDAPPLIEGIHAISARYLGNADFDPSTATAVQLVALSNTSQTSVATPVSSAYGQLVTLTATVSPWAAGIATVPEGSVQFIDVTTEAVLATRPLTAGSASFATAILNAGAHLIRATYTSTNGFTPSAGERGFQVNRATTVVAIISTGSPSAAGAAVTFTAQVNVVAPAEGFPEGSITFSDSGVVLNTVPVDSSRRAQLVISNLSVGEHTIQASYSGHFNFAPSLGTLPHRVNTWPTKRIDVTESMRIVDAVVPVPRANTPVGTNVVVLAQRASIVFGNVTAGGVTTIVSATVPSSPAFYISTTPATSFDISTTAQFTGSVQVTLPFPAGTISPRLMHYENGAWVDRTTAIDYAGRTVTGTVTSLSPFAVFQPAAREGRMSGDGAVDDERFEFELKERSLGTERGRLTLTRKAPRGHGRPRDDEFRSTTINDIVFWDDARYRASRRHDSVVDSVVFTGTGKWNGSPHYTFEAEATDRGEPGRGRDTLRITIRDPHGIVVLSSEGTLTAGNIQSHRIGTR
jgi:predicted outer membrane repeat protein